MHTLTSGQWERLRRTLMAQTTAGSSLLSVGRLANDCLVFTVRTRCGENIPIRIATDGRPLINGRSANQMTRPTRILFTFTQKETAMTQSPPLVMTLTLPEGGASEEATLLLQRGSFAHLTTFVYLSLADVTAALQDAQRQLTALEASPPILPAAVPAVPTAATRSASVKPAPTPKATDSLTIPVGKKTRTIPAHHLHAPLNQQAQAITIAGRLLAGGLWDGLSPIRITDAARTLKALKPLSDKDLTLFSLTDFVEVGPPDVLPEADDEERQVPEMPPMTWQVGDMVPLMPDAVDEDGELVPFDVGRIVEIDASEAGLRLWLESPDGDHDVWVCCDQLTAV